MAKWSLKKVSLPLKYTWKISRGSVAEKENFVVSYQEGKIIGRGEVAFLTQGEITPEIVEESFRSISSSLANSFNGLEDMMAILQDLDIPANLRFGIESAYIHFLAQLMDDKTQRVLGVREVTNVPTSYSLPHMNAESVSRYIQENNLKEYESLKLKITKFDDTEFVREVSKHYRGKIRLDGNECFKESSEVIEFLCVVKDLPIEFFEQPLSHLDFDECCRLREKSPVLLIADESLQDGTVVDDFQKAFHGVNVKLQKAGGYIKALTQLREARALGLKTMLGCMIETSLGVSSALTIAHGVDYYDLDGFLHLKEDPFNAVYVDKGHILYDYHH